MLKYDSDLFKLQPMKEDQYMAFLVPNLMFFFYFCTKLSKINGWILGFEFNLRAWISNLQPQNTEIESFCPKFKDFEFV